MTQAVNAAVLDGIRVLDMTLFLSGPFGTQILGDLGAEVIKIETGDGDQTRVLPPYFVGDDSAYYLSANRNKKSVVVDYRRPEGRALIEKLIAECDVLIENQRPGGLAKHGISWERAREINPSLIWCSISGFGQDGPYRERPAYDMVVQALSGGMSMTGEADGRPVRAAVPLADLSGGMYGVIGVLGALVGRQKSGKGQYIDVSMLDCQIAMLSYQAAYFLHSGKVPGRQGRGHESIPSYRAFTAGDGNDFVICANTDRMWRSLCEVIGRSDLGSDPAYAGRKERYQKKEEVQRILDEAFAAKPAHEWVALLHAAEVPVATVNTLDAALSDPQVLSRDMVMEMQSEDGHRARVAGNPLKMPELGTEPRNYPPGLGQHTREVLSGILGFNDATIGELLRSAVVSEGKRTKEVV